MKNPYQNINIDVLPICIVIYEIDEDNDFIFKNFNTAAERTEKVSREELIGHKVQEKFPGIESMGLLQLFHRVYESGKEETLEIGLYEDSKIYGWRKNIVSKLNETMLIVVYEDISNENELIAEFEKTLKQKTQELKKLTETLEERIEQEVLKNNSQQEQLFTQLRLAQLGEMISMIAHQWRQPLGAISTTASNLKLKLELELFDLHTQEGIEEANKYFLERLENIENFVQSLTTTIDDFRNFYKPNKHSIVVNIHKPFHKAFSIIKASFLAENIELIKKNQSNKQLQLYENEIMQVILNILKNAQDNFREKHIENPKIFLSCEDRGSSVIVKICDNGGGINETLIENIFDPYYSTKNEKNGTGLGLYMSKIIIEEHHNGKLNVYNTQEGVCFEITLYEKIPS